MSEVMRWKLKGFIPGVEGMSKALFQPTVVLAEDYDAAQSELAALREELAKLRERHETLKCQRNEAQQSLTAAEQRNIQDLRQAYELGYIDGCRTPDEISCKEFREKRLKDILARATESGSSE